MNKKIAIIGANGQLGVDIIRIAKSLENAPEIIPLTHDDIEITNATQVETVLSKIKPDIIINTAAYIRVDEIESNPEKAFLINAIGNRNLSINASILNSTMVYISTDYVFGGNNEKNTPYKESDLPDPVNAYGISKLAGEYFTQALCPKFLIIRSCGLFGVAGSSGKGGNFVETMIKKAKNKESIKVVNDQIVSPTYTLDLARQIFKLINTEHFGLFHAVSTDSCSWYEFAQAIFDNTKITASLENISSEELKTPAKRSPYTALENYNLKNLGINIMRTWEDSLTDYLKEKSYI